MAARCAEGRRLRIPPTQLASVLLLSLTLCLIEAASASPASQSPAKTYAEWATRELAGVEEGLSAADWLKSHAGEEMNTYEHRYANGEAEDDWAVRFVKSERLPDGREVIRRAYFYPPHAPSPPVLPVNKDARETLMNESRLGLIWIESMEPDVKTGEALAASARQSITERFGAGEPKPQVHFLGSAYWTENSRWRAGKAMIVSTYIKGSGTYDVKTRRAVAFSYLPNSGITTDWDEAVAKSDGSQSTDEGRRARLDRMLKVAALGDERSAPLLSALDKAARWDGGEKFQAAPLASALKQWLDAAAKLDATRRAAAYFVADYVLEHTWEPFGLSTPGINKRERAQLAALGADFTPAPRPVEGDSHSYTNSWMKRAVRLNPVGQSGETALVDLLERGILVNEKPNENSEDFRPVIKEGEKYLSRAKDSQLKAAAHLVVANAYSDIVALADGIGEDAFPPESYRAEATPARQKAIENYRAAFSIDNTTPQARSAWSQAWRLLAGLPPIKTTYFSGNEPGD